MIIRRLLWTLRLRFAFYLALPNVFMAKTVLYDCTMYLTNEAIVNHEPTGTFLKIAQGFPLGPSTHYIVI